MNSVKRDTIYKLLAVYTILTWFLIQFHHFHFLSIVLSFFLVLVPQCVSTNVFGSKNSVLVMNLHQENFRIYLRLIVEMPFFHFEKKFANMASLLQFDQSGNDHSSFILYISFYYLERQCYLSTTHIFHHLIAEINLVSCCH